MLPETQGAVKIPVSVVIVTKNEESCIDRCLSALTDFGEVVVVDSHSTDKTRDIAQNDHKARVVLFDWNGQYPKKRQWCLDNLDLAFDWVFFVDADEEVTPDLVQEVRSLRFDCAGYFVRGQYVFAGKALRFGLKNNKLALIDRRKMHFPVVDDLDLEGMGEIEGHYQPVIKPSFTFQKTRQIKAELLHYAYEDEAAWQARHERYAVWEAAMNKRKAWPKDARLSKVFFQAMPFRSLAAFIHSYIFKIGFLDGKLGYQFARSRMRYYRMIR